MNNLYSVFLQVIGDGKHSEHNSDSGSQGNNQISEIFGKTVVGSGVTASPSAIVGNHFFV